MKTVLTFTGKRGNGKTTAARILEERGYTHLNFADPVRETAKIVYGLTDEEMNDPVLKELVIDRYPFRSPREILTRIGTECFRNYIADTWTQALKRRVEPYEKVVVSDLRFLNEAVMIRSMGGKIVRVIDPRKPATDVHSKHVSEVEMDLIEVDTTIINDKSIEDLHRAVLEFVGSMSQ